MEYSESFFINITSLIIGLIILVIRMIYKSKCEQFNICFGLFSFKRDIKSEIIMDKYKIDHGIKDSENNINLTELPGSRVGENNNNNK